MCFQQRIDPLPQLGIGAALAVEEGNPVGPAYYGLSPEAPSEMLITVTFTEHEGKTTLTIRQTVGSTPPSERQGMQQGWTETLDRLADYVEGGA